MKVPYNKMPKFAIQPMHDEGHGDTIDHPIFNVPFRLLIIGRSGLSGKTTMLSNLLLRKRFYRNMWNGDNIYVISPSLDTDPKWRKICSELRIPAMNQQLEYDENWLTHRYEDAVDNHLHSVGPKKQRLLVLDDTSFGGAMRKKRFGILNKYFCNGRHYNWTVMATAQQYNQLDTPQRENSNFIFYQSTGDQARTIGTEHGYGMMPMQFVRFLNEHTREPHAFMAVDYSKGVRRYLDRNFEEITPDYDDGAGGLGRQIRDEDDDEEEDDD